MIKLILIVIVMYGVALSQTLVQDSFELLLKNKFSKDLKSKDLKSYTILFDNIPQKEKDLKPYLRLYFLDQEYAIIKKDKIYVLIYKVFENKKDASLSKQNVHPRMVDRVKVVSLYSLLPKTKQEKLHIEKNKIILNRYAKALQHYKAKRYEDAYTIFNQLFEEDLNNININFFLARSAYELQKYNEAVLAYERVLFEKPDAPIAQIEMGKTLLQLKQYKEAKRYFQNVKKQEKLPKNVAKAADFFLDITEKKIQKHFVKGIMMVGVSYDDNIDSTPFDHDLVFNNIVIRNAQEKNAGYAHQEVVVVNHSYKYDDTKTLKNDFLVFSKKYFDSTESNKDVQMVSYSPALSIKYNDILKVDYTVFVDHLWLNKESILQSYGIIPKINYFYDKQNIIDGYLKYQDKNNQKEADKIKDSRVTELSGAHKYIFAKNLIIGNTIALTQERKNKGKDTSIDKDQFLYKANLTYILKNGISLASYISLKNTSYKDKALSNDGIFKYRSDSEYKFSLSGSYVYDKKWIFQGVFDTLKNDSNNDAYRYNKNTFSINVVRSF